MSQSADPQFTVKEDTPYAELWMGTHPNGPSRIYDNSGNCETTLEAWLKDHKDQLGSKVKEDFKGDLPYMFKVLSVNTSLSIQAHPNKVLAEKLHRKSPDIYKDPNHKPEMAIALTPFQAMCGFRPIAEIAKFVQEIDELHNAVGIKHVPKLVAASRSYDQTTQMEAMKEAFTGLMMQDKNVIERELNKLVQTVTELKNGGNDVSNYVGDVLLKLNAEYPDCMECMACSDNVVRAGLTPKLRDVHTLCDMLDYTGKMATKTKFKGQQRTENGAYITDFIPPIKDFTVTKYEIPEDCKSLKLKGLDSASICIVIQGQGQISNRTLKNSINIVRGSVFFISANEDVDLKVTSPGMLLFRAYARVI
ncbi:hypothetical protein KUTeg_011991 [Tegillarca granosa]|uniref:mannose-6-phosphate isomerase n=1 Tax=Tegillarca granosa TaxID=220873 RepID=A0ABQ9F0P4_TEGGR|nr:hypothetical protein KUTeg_011991 [Tegillarca granosa]